MQPSETALKPRQADIQQGRRVLATTVCVDHLVGVLIWSAIIEPQDPTE